MAKNYHILDFQVSMELSHQDASVGEVRGMGEGNMRGWSKKMKEGGGQKILLNKKVDFFSWVVNK